jgi:hypothetical protein
VGCLWIKFLPLQEPVQDCFREILSLKSEKLAVHINLFEQFGYIAQISEFTDELTTMLQTKVTVVQESDIFSRIYLADTKC